MRHWHVDLAGLAAAFAATVSLLPYAYTQTAIPSDGLPVGACTATIPCTNGACCNGKSGFCGFGPEFCGSTNCTSNCDAVAECGPYATAENRSCPLNVCCSQYGFCGQTDEFCQKGCQSNCNPTAPVGGGDNVKGGGVKHRRIGYYEGWAVSSKSRNCDFYQPEQVAAEVLTHVNFAFALISSSFQLIEMASGDHNLWRKTTDLKKRNAGLEVWLSVGGWTFNDPPTSHIFSDLVSDDANVKKFIISALSVMQAYGFDGIDIDWEYPAAYDRGGKPSDKDNYTKFMKKVKSAFQSKYGLSFTAPSSYWYLQHFDIPSLIDVVDFVNVMSYDLHGTWDGTDPWIGKVVLAHTNLTEIKNTLQLFQNVFTSPTQWKKVNIGFGFYGRSFELVSSECSKPGCPFAGPADAGPCTKNPGTLSFREIGSIIDKHNLEPILDEEAAVKYIVWNDRQWVSYDDDETFRLKTDYLDTIVGGSFVWSIDQDDTKYTALNALYPDIDYNDVGNTQSNQCKYTRCGESCPSQWNLMTTLTTPPQGPKCDNKHRASLCCPKGATPQNCQWRGGGKSTCKSECEVGQVTLALDPAGNPKWPTCHKGTQAFCCNSGTTMPLHCFGADCGMSRDAPAGYTFMTMVKQGSWDPHEYCEYGIERGTGPCPSVCSTNNRPVFCATETSVSDCHWVGTVPACTDAVCPVGEVSVFQDIQGDAETTCSGQFRRNFCCRPPKSEQFSPVPGEWVIPFLDSDGLSIPEQPVSFTVDFDDNIGPSDPDAVGTGSAGLSDDAQENDSPFGEVFITSPNPQSVSSLDINSDWVLVGCDASSEEPQTIMVYCSLPMEDLDAGCAHVHIGGAEHTIVRMPKSCGAGPYSRVTSFREHENPSALPIEHALAVPNGEKVYQVSFDYDFTAIPDENGPIFMRADMTDMLDYWDSIINTPPDDSPTQKRDEIRHLKRNFHDPPSRRWFGGFKQWLERINTITNINSVTRNYHWSDKYTLYHARESCPNLESSLDISVAGVAQASSEFGYYLEATIVPPAIQQAYVYLSAGASARATFTLEGTAKAEWSSLPYELVSFGFPGLHYPGLLTLGPSLHLYAGLSGEISLAGQLSATVGYTFPSIHYALGSTTDSPTFGSTVSPTASNHVANHNLNYNVELKGGVSAYLTPSLELGLSVLNGKVMDATVYVQTELQAGLNLNGSVSKTQSPEFCIQPNYGVNLHGGLKGAVLYWSGEFDHIFYQGTFDYGGECFNSETFSNKSRERELAGNYSFTAAQGSMRPIRHDAERIVYSRWEKKAEQEASTTTEPVAVMNEPVTTPIAGSTFAASSHRKKRDAIPYLPGSLFCPAVSSDLTQETDSGADCICYSDAVQDIENSQDQDVLARRDVASTDHFSLGLAFGAALGSETSFDNGTHTLLFHPIELNKAQLRVCRGVSIKIPTYSKTNIIAYYDHVNPGTLDPTVGSYTQLPLDTAGKLTFVRNIHAYAREHVYEQSMSSLFVDYLAYNEDLWQNAAGNTDFCVWVRDNLQSKPSYFSTGDSVLDQLGNCYPGNTEGLTSNMLILEQTINTKKNLVLQDGERQLITSMKKVSASSDKAFTSYCAQKQVAVLRALAGIPSYFNDFVVKREFIKANDCIRNVWTSWYLAYTNQALAAFVDAPRRGSVNVPQIYDNFIYSIMKNVKPFVVSEVTRLIELYDDLVKNDNGKRVHGAPPIDLSFYVLMDNQQVKNKNGDPVRMPATVYTSQALVSKQDLTDQILNKIPDLALLSDLPQH